MRPILLVLMVLVALPTAARGQSRALQRIETLISTGQVDSAREELADWWEEGFPSASRQDIQRMAQELKSSSEIGAEFYVIHPGSQKHKSPDWGVRRAAEAVARAAERAGRCPVILLENTASPYGPGGRFETLGAVIGKLREAAPGLRMGVAIDSCHAFGAGYDMREPAEVERLVSEAHAAVGLSSLHLIHANDSRDAPGSGRDRHYHIGKGTIGNSGMRNLLCHPPLSHLPLILETPWESFETDLENMRAVRHLLRRDR